MYKSYGSKVKFNGNHLQKNTTCTLKKYFFFLHEWNSFLLVTHSVKVNKEKDQTFYHLG